MSSHIVARSLDLAKDNPYLSIFLVFAFVLTSVTFWTWRDALQVDPQEPPVAVSKIPFIGHVIGIMRDQIRYFEILCAKYSWPIFTLKVFSTRIYVIRSPELAQAALRNTKSLTFDKFSIEFIKNALGASQRVMDIISKKPVAEGEGSYMTDIHHEMYSGLALGPSLLKSNARILNCLTKYLDIIDTNGSKLELYNWLRNAYTLSMGETLYGPENPITENPKLIDTLWDFENGAATLMLGVFPSLLARKAYQARLTMGAVFKKYYNAGLDKNANEFIQGRVQTARRYGLTNAEISSFEVVICHAAVTNAVPMIFWMLSYVFSDSNLTSSLREEISGIITRTKVSRSVDKVDIDIAKIRTHCPLLVSTYEETLRIMQAGVSIRFVSKDVLLDDAYLLKKGSIVQIVTGVLHTAPATWGENSDTFNSRRFIDRNTLPKDKKKPQMQGFIPFGGGKHLCPGRHLAFTEIVGFAAMLILGFDVDGVGILKTIPHKLGWGTRKPKGDLKVLIKRREVFRDVRWSFTVGDLKDMENLSPE